MRKKIKVIVSVALVMAMVLTGCGSSQNSQAESTIESTDEEATSAIITTSNVEVDTEFSASDLDVGYEDSTATHITMNGNTVEVTGNGAIYKDEVLTISDEGTYVISGTLIDGQIIVDTEDSDKVQIVLNNAAITCSDNAPIYIKNADKVFITLKEGTKNTLIDGIEYVLTDDTEVDGVIFSKVDLTINGEGTLNITGNYKNGIVSKDEFIITNGMINITAVKDTINGKDCVKIKDGTFKLNAATGNGIQSKNSDDETKGYVYITGGDITISKSKEGIEGTVILIEDGTINITAEDDGLNSAIDTSSDTEISAQGDPRQGNFGGGGGAFQVDINCYISITGGNITVDASGDGIDTNGSLYISGGNTYVSGPEDSGNGGLDYNGTAEITGGTLVVVGSAGMAQGLSDTSSQYSLLYNLNGESEGGTEVKLTDKDGNVVASYIPNKKYQSVLISTPNLTKVATYNLTSGDHTEEITLTSVVTSNVQQGMGGFGGRGEKPGKPGQTKTEESE